MSVKQELQTAWEEWKRGAQILAFFSIYCVAGCILAMAVSIAISEALKWAIGDASQDKSLFIYCSLLLGTTLVPFMAGAAMEKWQEAEDEEAQGGLSL
jgi:TRAP-type C4-dicarboxylate transport system permease small subunit